LVQPFGQFCTPAVVPLQTLTCVGLAHSTPMFWRAKLRPNGRVPVAFGRTSVGFLPTKSLKSPGGGLPRFVAA
jgi:hypothetical protein